MTKAGDSRPHPLLAEWLPVPGPHDDKYSRGVVTLATGSRAYPGAALIGTEAAARCGVGMVRYDGPAEVAMLAIARTPSIVTGRGHSQTIVAGSGWSLDDEGAAADRLREAIADDHGAVRVLDAGAIALMPLDTPAAERSRTVITPHAGEAESLFERTGDARARKAIEADPRDAARELARRTGAIVVLKGHETVIATRAGALTSVVAPTARLATAGTGDALAGILGAVLALAGERVQGGDEDALAAACAAAVTLHGLAAEAASGADNAPITPTDLTKALPGVIARHQARS